MYNKFRTQMPKDAKPGPHKYIPLPTCTPPFPHEEHYSFSRYADYAGPDRHAALKAEARKVTTPYGSRSSPLQRCLLRLVFDMVTPYPDQIWTKIIVLASGQYVRLLQYT
jgi:hypothetical protein